MITGGMVFFVFVVLIALGVLIKIFKFRHKFLAVLLIALILFGYFSFNTAFKGQDIDLTDFKGVAQASGIYFSWLGSVFGNVQTITSKTIENNSENNLAWK